MKLSRKWLNEFVDVAPVGDRDFAEAMTLSGSKVEITEVLNESLKNVVVGKLLSLERHPDSDHMWVCQLDVGADEPVQIVTGAWNIHVGDLVPAALHKSLLPGGVKIEKGKLRGVPSNGMLCSLKELGLTAEHDYPYAVITPAALLNDYHPLDKDKPSIPADIQPGDKAFGPVVCARVLSCETKAAGRYAVKLDTGSGEAEAETPCANLHEGDLAAFNTKTNTVCTLSDLHAQQAEFPHCIPDGIFVLHEDGAKPGDDIAAVLGLDDHVVEFEITPNRPDCLSVIGLAREASATFGKELQLHTPEIKGCGDSIADHLDIEIEDGELCPRYTARMVRNVKIGPSPKWMRERLRAMGVRPINNIVDITNYVMLEYGQPMHAFDFSCVEDGQIVVRTAREGETIQTLDGKDRELTQNMLVIADAEGATGLELSCGQGHDGPAEYLGLIGRAGHAEHDARGAYGAHVESHESEQTVVEKKEQQQNGNAAEEPYIEADQHGGRSRGVHLRDRHGHAEAEAQGKSSHDEHHGDQRSFENVGEGFDDGGKNMHC